MSNTSSGRTPWHFWVIGILLLAWNAMGALDYVMTQTANEAYMAQFSEEQLAYFYGFPIWVVALWAISVWGAVLGSILLLLRRGLAQLVFVISLITFVLNAVYTFGLSNGLEMMGTGGAIFSGVIFLVEVFSVWYASRMKARRVLR